MVNEDKAIDKGLVKKVPCKPRNAKTIAKGNMNANTGYISAMKRLKKVIKLFERKRCFLATCIQP
jgi:folate-dependent tRNA-U54 methylase TrmFO/GidA